MAVGLRDTITERRNKLATKDSKKTTGPGGVEVKKMSQNYDISEAIQVWHGPPKSGKSITAAALEHVSEQYGLPVKPFVFHFEPGTGGFACTGTCETCPQCGGKGKEGRSLCPMCNGDEVVRKVISSVDEFREWLEWFTDSEYNLAVIDTMDRCYQVISDSICATLQIPGPHASDHGLAWTMIYDELRELLAIPIEAGKGMILIMHVYMMERRVRGGNVQTATFNVSGKSRQYIAGLADQILYFDVVPHETEDRDKYVIFSRAQSGIEAGDRWNIFPEELDRGGLDEKTNLPVEAAEKILECYGYLET
jgi:hypothetical protein